jgi:hypothetical protein
VTLLWLLACLPSLEAEKDEEVVDTAVSPVDNDGDGFTADVDCDDDNPALNPDAVEVCDGIDNDCDGEVDEEGLTVFFGDADGDGFGDADAPTEPTCEQPDDTVLDDTDCDDGNPEAFPGNDELCTTDFDDDCDGEVNEDDALDVSDWFDDGDSDSFGAGDAVTQCEAPEGHVDNGDDCDDTEDSVFPGADEQCNGVDDDCDEVVPADETDDDGDGFVECTDEDCDDTDDAVYLDADEYCGNEVDDDCDGTIDELDDAVDARVFYADDDGDGQGDPDADLLACEAPSSYVSNDTDCDDTDDSVYDSASELCDGQDNDCDGSLDATENDDDNDGYVECTVDSDGWDGTAITGGEDCDDGRALTNPGADEYCNTEDDDCDGTVDEDDALDATTWYVDSDGDGYGTSSSTVACDQPSGYASGTSDCDDTDNTAFPNAPEVCGDGILNDCNATDTDECGPYGTWNLDDAEYGFLGRDSGDLLGSKVRGGDVDGDGNDDVIAIAPYSESGSAGGAYVWLGPVTSGDLDDADQVFEGQVNGSTIEYATNALMAEDLDGDGNADFVLATEPAAAVYIFYGPLSGGDPSTADVSLDMTKAKEGDFGDELLTADLDDDGNLDLVVGAPDFNNKNSNSEGAVWVLHGPITSDSTSLKDSTDFDRSMFRGSSKFTDLGRGLTVGDFDGDGKDEVAVGGPNTATCEVGTLESQSQGTQKKFVDAADWYLTGSGLQCGAAMDAGDQNNDGYDDLAFSSMASGGRVYIFNGPLSGTNVTYADVTLSNTNTSNLGNGVALGGDIDGDGNADLVAGDYRNSTQRGTAWFFVGPLTGTLTVSSADGTWSGGSTYDYATYDHGLVYAGDPSGDGYDDLLVGVAWDDESATSAGAARLMTGGPNY